MPDTPSIFQSLALLLGGLFAGTCLYATAVAHPIRLTFGPRPPSPIFVRA